MAQETLSPYDVLSKAEGLRGTLSTSYRDEIVKSLYNEAETIAKRAVKTALDKKYDLDQKIDRLVTSPIVGLPIMLILLGIIIWITVSFANVASAAIGNVLFSIGDWGRALFVQVGMPWWITGFIWDGVYLALAWVISVMLPPMAIFFPCFTFLEYSVSSAGTHRYSANPFPDATAGTDSRLGGRPCQAVPRRSSEAVKKCGSHRRDAESAENVIL